MDVVQHSTCTKCCKHKDDDIHTNIPPQTKLFSFAEEFFSPQTTDMDRCYFQEDVIVEKY